MSHFEQLLSIDFFQKLDLLRILLGNTRIRSRQKPVNYDWGTFATHSFMLSKENKQIHSALLHLSVENELASCTHTKLACRLEKTDEIVYKRKPSSALGGMPRRN